MLLKGDAKLMKNSLAKRLLLVILLLCVMPKAFCEKGKLEPFYMQIVGKYFENFKDYQNLEMVNKKFEDAINYYRKNYIPLTEENIKFFENLETYVAHPGESKTIDKLNENISHLVYFENSFDCYRFDKVMKENKINPSEVKIIKLEDDFSLSCDWEMKIVPLVEDHGCKIIFSRENEVKNKTETITFYLDVFNMSCYQKGDFKFSRAVASYNNLTCYISDLFGGIPFPQLKINKITKIMIPEKVESIGENAFFGFESLEEIQIPDGVVSIKENAFMRCRNLKKVEIPSSVKFIGNRAFKECQNLENIFIPNSVENLGVRVFSDCERLKEVRLSNSIKEISENAFFRCPNLKSIEIPNSVEKIGKGAFRNCVNLDKISLPNTVKFIDSNAFESCF